MGHRHGPLHQSKQADADHRVRPHVSSVVLCCASVLLTITVSFLSLNRDCEIQFYELANFEPYCQLRKLESIPLRACFW